MPTLTEVASQPGAPGPDSRTRVSAAPTQLTEAPTLELDHLGLIVPDLAAGREFLTRSLGITRWTPVTEDPVLLVSVQFGAAETPAATHGLTYELIAPFGDASPIANALRTGKHILNHLAYLTPDLDASAARLREEGCYAAGEPQPALAYGGRRVQFWMSPLRFVIELIEKPGHRHVFEDLGL